MAQITVDVPNTFSLVLSKKYAMVEPSIIQEAYHDMITDMMYEYLEDKLHTVNIRKQIESDPELDDLLTSMDVVLCKN